MLIDHKNSKKRRKKNDNDFTLREMRYSYEIEDSRAWKWWPVKPNETGAFNYNKRFKFTNVV